MKCESSLLLLLLSALSFAAGAVIARQYPGILNNDALICYMASVINSFFHCKPLRRLILEMPTERNDRVQAALQITLGRMQRKDSDIPIGTNEIAFDVT